MPREKQTEERIFEAATAVFHEAGFDGARMQEIARRADINQSMLHYYFRSKGRLFDAVFRRTAREVFPPALAVLQSDLPLLDKIEGFVGRYIEVIMSNPHVPAFVLQELRRNPNALRELIRETASGLFEGLRRQVDEAAARGEIRPIRAEHLFANVVALCVFPFIARPMLQTAIGVDDERYDILLQERKREVTTFIRQALRP